MAKLSLLSSLQPEQRAHRLHLQYQVHDNNPLNLNLLLLLKGPRQHLRHHLEDQVHQRYHRTLNHHHSIMRDHQDYPQSAQLLAILSQVLDLLPPLLSCILHQNRHH
jgi:hypothetical protein